MPDSFDDGPTYSALVQTLFSERQHVGQLLLTEHVVSGQAGSLSQGTHVRFWLKSDQGRVRQARFEAYACPHIVAGASYLASWAEGKTLDELLAWRWRPLADSLQAPVEKWGKFLILEDALKAAARVASRVE
jgi:NifU-like protein involved in Fe-S cluster formation